jgi:hypothetical protein
MQWRVVNRAHGKGFLLIECKHGVYHGGFAKECERSLWQKPPEGAMWQWNGSTDAPTITPSINCLGGCNRHFTMTNGVPTGELGE